MKAQGFPDGQKFKAMEKDVCRFLPEQSYAVVRFDGKNFSQFTKQFARPYDERFMNAMDEASRKMAAAVTGATLAYTQSDEISIIFNDLHAAKSQMWFNGKVDKILSIGAATVTALFLQALDFDFSGTVPVFDARVHALNGREEVEEYVRWRRFDAQKNSVTMAAQTLYSHKQLMNISSKERLALLSGTEFETLPEGFYNGRVSFRESYLQPATRVLKSARKNVEVPTEPVEVIRHRWVSEPATREFMETKFETLL